MGNILHSLIKSLILKLVSKWELTDVFHILMYELYAQIEQRMFIETIDLKVWKSRIKKHRY